MPRGALLIFVVYTTLIPLGNIISAQSRQFTRLANSPEEQRNCTFTGSLKCDDPAYFDNDWINELVGVTN